MEDKEKESLLRTYFTFWDQLDQTQKQVLLAHTTHTFYPKYSMIHDSKKECVGVLLLIKGQLRTYMLSEEGRDITLYRLFKGDICILSASCILEEITFEVSISAEEDCEVLFINSTIFHQLAQQNIYMRCFGYEIATRRFSDVMWAMQQILFMGADKRLAIFLLDELARSGDTKIVMTHEQIARYIGSAREVVSRMLKYFSMEGLVELSRGTIQIKDKEKLRMLATTIS